MNSSGVAGILQFTGYDYGTSIALLTFSALIGVYYGFIAKQKQNNPNEYLLGGKSIGLFPISISLIVWQISGMTLLGLPVEVYTNGTQQWASIISVIGVGLALKYVYLPVFYDLQCATCFTYLELRFDKQVKNFVSLLYTISMLLFIPTVIYIPAIAFNQVSGINLYVILVVTCLVCIFYTTVGGLKAVVWTDAIQFFMMLAAVLSIIFVAGSYMEGFADVWRAADRGKRVIFFDINPSPFQRLSFWSVTIGLTFQMIASICISPTVVQRCVSLPDYGKVMKSLVIFLIGITFFNICAHITGLQMYARYETCDPFSAGYTKKIDQVLPYFVMDVGGSVPGLAGLFISGIFAAAMSTMSSSLNTLSGTIYEDFLKSHFVGASDEKTSNIMKLIVVILGLILIALVVVVDKLGPIYELSLTLSSVTNGAMLGIFTMGMVCRSANTKGVIAGAMVSVSVVGVAIIGAQSSKLDAMLPMRVDGCNWTDSDVLNSTRNTHTTSTIPGTNDSEEPFWLFEISFMYYAFIGFVLVFIVGYPISLMTGKAKRFDEILLLPYKRIGTEYHRL
ncbi:sodium-coupled monocarboxylate transporter 2-like [Bradysia coprophila]|uniref:sodium-coupled monocarboxylate transporter 2-like n=1 Tax=Bradysia coprophila TaxID=38358 RepID=UPI00187D8A7E|nr:sodium-coupled monocarboxylate transporter 2-like [Bradysia coprophila]